MKRLISIFILFTFVSTTVIPPSYAQTIGLPVPGSVVPLTPAFTPVLVKGINIYPDNHLKFDFIIDQGDAANKDEDFKAESTKLIKYFLASLTVPEEEMWVNLSPYEQGRIIPEHFGQTEMGRDLLAQDYLLKQLTASLMNPEDTLGKTFWDKVYKQAQEKFNTTDIPMNTFNKIWIVPEKAKIYEHTKGAFIVDTHLKVMLEEDYLALEMNKDRTNHGVGEPADVSDQVMTGVQSQVVKEVLIPAIEKEVNEGKTFSQLRQIYYSFILASWYKKALKESLLGKAYADQNKTQGVDIQDKDAIQKIYDQYVAAFQKGVYNTIKEEYDPNTQEVISRKYFSGGAKFTGDYAALSGGNQVQEAISKAKRSSTVTWEGRTADGAQIVEPSTDAASLADKIVRGFRFEGYVDILLQKVPSPLKEITAQEILETVKAMALLSQIGLNLNEHQINTILELMIRARDRIYEARKEDSVDNLPDMGLYKIIRGVVKQLILARSVRVKFIAELNSIPGLNDDTLRPVRKPKEEGFLRQYLTSRLYEAIDDDHSFFMFLDWAKRDVPDAASLVEHLKEKINGKTVTVPGINGTYTLKVIEYEPHSYVARKRLHKYEDSSVYKGKKLMGISLGDDKDPVWTFLVSENPSGTTFGAVEVDFEKDERISVAPLTSPDKSIMLSEQNEDAVSMAVFEVLLSSMPIPSTFRGRPDSTAIPALLIKATADRENITLASIHNRLIHYKDLFDKHGFRWLRIPVSIDPRIIEQPLNRVLPQLQGKYLFEATKLSKSPTDAASLAEVDSETPVTWRPGTPAFANQTFRSIWEARHSFAPGKGRSDAKGIIIGLDSEVGVYFEKDKGQETIMTIRKILDLEPTSDDASLVAASSVSAKIFELLLTESTFTRKQLLETFGEAPARGNFRQRYIESMRKVGILRDTPHTRVSREESIHPDIIRKLAIKRSQGKYEETIVEIIEVLNSFTFSSGTIARFDEAMARAKGYIDDILDKTDDTPSKFRQEKIGLEALARQKEQERQALLEQVHETSLALIDELIRQLGPEIEMGIDKILNLKVGAAGAYVSDYQAPRTLAELRQLFEGHKIFISIFSFQQWRSKKGYMRISFSYDTKSVTKLKYYLDWLSGKLEELKGGKIPLTPEDIALKAQVLSGQIALALRRSGLSQKYVRVRELARSQIPLDARDELVRLYAEKGEPLVPFSKDDPDPDPASLATEFDEFTKGGIDFNPSNLKIDVDRQGQGVQMPNLPQNIPNIQIDGIVPFIINITPITNLPLFLGFTMDQEEKTEEVSYNKPS